MVYNARRALIIAPVRHTHAHNASQSGLAARIRCRPILEDIELRRRGGRHARALEELLTRAERAARPPRHWPGRYDRGRFTKTSPAAGGLALRADGLAPVRAIAHMEAARRRDATLPDAEEMC